MNFSVSLLAVLSIIYSVSALSAVEWRSQSIYHLLTDRFARTSGSAESPCDISDYCGGTWKGIIHKLDYIQEMGFTAIWISPVVEQIDGNSADGSSYHGYWAQNINKLNRKFGTEADLLALSDALHSRGMYLMVDVVTNHMAYLGPGNAVDYSTLAPFNDKRFYHDFCLIDYENTTSIENCWMGSNTFSLPDLRTESKEVSDVWEQWIKGMVTKYKIDGLRLDSTQQVNRASLRRLESAAGVYVMGEIFNGDPARVCPYQQELSGVLNFPNYYWITQAFESTSGSISNLVRGINTMKTSCRDTTTLGSFLENHDSPRFTSINDDLSLAKNALGVTMFADGISIVYYGSEQRFSGSGVPSNREPLWSSNYDTSSPLYTFIRTLNLLRQHIASSSYANPSFPRLRRNSHGHTHLKSHTRFHSRRSQLSDPHSVQASVIYSDNSTIAMQRGDHIGVYSNLGGFASGSYSLTLSRSQTNLGTKTRLVEVLNCVRYTTDERGDLKIAMESGLPRVLYPEEKLKGSKLCTDGVSTTTLPAATAPPTSTCPPIPVTFNLNVQPTTNTKSSSTNTTTTTTLKIVGEQLALGQWNPENAVLLTHRNSTAWSVTLTFSPGTRVLYKFIKVDSVSGGVTWESRSNRAVRVPDVEACGGTGIAFDDVWNV